jgi:hypothetical protein
LLVLFAMACTAPAYAKTKKHTTRSTKRTVAAQPTRHTTKRTVARTPRRAAAKRKALPQRSVQVRPRTTTAAPSSRTNRVPATTSVVGITRQEPKPAPVPQPSAVKDEPANPAVPAAADPQPAAPEAQPAAPEAQPAAPEAQPAPPAADPPAEPEGITLPTLGGWDEEDREQMQGLG